MNLPSMMAVAHTIEDLRRFCVVGLVVGFPIGVIAAALLLRQHWFHRNMHQLPRWKWRLVQSGVATWVAVSFWGGVCMIVTWLQVQFR